MNDTPYTHFRIVGFGLSGSVAADIPAAWASYFRAGRRAFGYRPGEHDATAQAAHSARLVEATTRRAARAADPSAVEGWIGRGHWRTIA